MRKLNAESLNSKIEGHVNSDIESGRVLGANIYISQGGVALLDKNYGYSRVDKSELLKHDSIFRMASMTKPVIAVCLLREMEKGRLSLCDKLSKFIPRFENCLIGEIKDLKPVIVGQAKNSPTILNCLTHTSGIGSGELGCYYGNEIPASAFKSLAQSVEYYAKFPLELEPGTRQSYSPTAAFDVLAWVVEITSGKNIEEYLQSELCMPLGMTDTTFLPTESQWSRIVDMHEYDGKQISKSEMFPGCVFENFPASHCCGGAGLISTVHDYARFAEMLRGGGELDGVRILSKETVDSLSQSHLPDSIKEMYPQAWSLGMRSIVGKEYGRMAVGSFGWSGAYGTHFYVDPANEIVAVYMKNSRYDGGAGCLTGTVFEQDIFEAME